MNTFMIERIVRKTKELVFSLHKLKHVFSEQYYENSLRGSKVKGLNCKGFKIRKKDIWVELGRRAFKELPRSRVELSKRGRIS